MFLLWLRQLPLCGDWTPASAPPPAKSRPSPINSPVFPPSFFVLPNFAWVCILFSTSYILLFALSWCSGCLSVSEGVFLMYPWREMYSTSTYSYTILFSLWYFFFYCVLHSPLWACTSLVFQPHVGFFSPCLQGFRQVLLPLKE